MRINWIDNLRWLWILLIVLWHCYFPDKTPLVMYLFTFHVALFFFLSWYLYNDEKHNNLLEFAKNKLNRLIIPFIFFNAIMFIYLMLEKKYWWWTYWWNIITFFKWITYWSYIDKHQSIILTNVPTWFLPSLFVVSIYYFILNKFLKNKIYKTIILFALSIWIYTESKYIHFRLPWSAEISIMAMLFYGLWHTYKKEISNFVEKINYYYLFLVPVLIWFNFHFISRTNFSSNYYGQNYLLFLVDAIFWIITFIIISKLINYNKFLSFLWKNSIIILGMEWIKFIVLSFVIRHSFQTLVFEKSYIIAFVQFFSTIIVLIPTIYIINRFFPFILWFNWKIKN